MRDKGIKRLRFKFWLVLTSSFTTLMLIGGFLVYSLIAHHTYQEQRRWISSPAFARRVREGVSAADEFFIAMLQEDGEAWVHSNFFLPGGEYEILVEWAMEAVAAEAGLPQLNNDWFSTLFRALTLSPSTHFTAGDRTWSFAVVEDFEASPIDDMLTAHDSDNIYLWHELAEDDVVFHIENSLVSLNFRELQERAGTLSAIQYLVFVDVSQNAAELASLARHLSNLGALGFIAIGVFSYLFSYFLVRPIAKNSDNQLQFIADASHELKTPLTILKSNLEVVMESQEESVAEQMEWLENMEFGLDRMTNLTRNLLTLTQLESPVKQQKSTFDLAAMAKRATLALKASHKEIQWQIDLEPTFIKQDEDRLLQVVMILLDNAVKYVEPGGTISVKVAKARHHGKFSVTNTGPGIPPDKLPRIFERFYRGDESRNSEANSYGLGLAIAKGIITQAGGKIHVQSIPNEKTAFSFTVKI